MCIRDRFNIRMKKICVYSEDEIDNMVEGSQENLTISLEKSGIQKFIKKIK